MGDGVKANWTRIAEFVLTIEARSASFNLMLGRMPSERLFAEPVPMAILGNTPVRVMLAFSPL